MKHNHFFTLTLVGLFCVGIVGCDADARFSRIEGTVTYNGVPVEGAIVNFQATTPDGESASGFTNASGRYTLTSVTAVDGGRGALPGEYRVAITKFEPAPPDPYRDAMMREEISYEEYIRRVNAGGPPPPPKHLLPEKYSSTGTSGLTATVVRGRNPPFDFNLTDD